MVISKVYCQNKIDTSDNYETNDVFFAEITCYLIQNHDTNGKIIVIDSTLKDSIIGIAIFWILFDNIDSLNIDSIELNAIIRRNPTYIQIRKENAEFEFYDKRLTSIVEEQLKCWYLYRYDNSLYSINKMINIHFAIYPCNVRK
jgi:hypothetical protein